MTALPDLKVAVVGGSLSGLVAAIAFARLGAQTEVFERSSRPLAGRGAGIVLHPATMAILPPAARDQGTRVTRLQYVDRTGAVTHQRPCSYRFTSYFALYEALLKEYDDRHYHLGREVAEFTQTPDHVTIHLADGTSAEAGLLVCADGIRSAARRRLLPDVRPHYSGYVAWRGTLAGRALSHPGFDLLADSITYCVLPSSHILIYPLPAHDGSLSPRNRLINWVWYRNVREGRSLDALMTDRNGTRQPVSLGSGAVPRATLDSIRITARDELPTALSELVIGSPEPFVQLVVDIAVPRMAFGRAALIGDASFALRPHVAAGTAKGAEDAITLAEAIATAPSDVRTALTSWQVRRLAVGAAAMKRARRAGARAQFDNSWVPGEPLPFGLHRDGDSALD